MSCSPRSFPPAANLKICSPISTAPALRFWKSPKLEFEKKEETEDFADLELAQDVGDKTNDPVRMYLREMGTVPLLTREGEIELAKRNERGQWAVRKALSRSPLVIHEIIQLGEDLRRGAMSVRDVLVLPEFVITDEDFTAQLEDLLAKIGEIEKYYKKSQQFRQKLQAVSRQMKPKQHRDLRYGLARNMVQISRIIRSMSRLAPPSAAVWPDRLRSAVDELKPLEREIARMQRKLEEPANARPSGARSAQGAPAVQPAHPAIGRRMRQPAPPSCAVRCRSSSAASWKRKPPRSSSSRPTCAWWFPSPNAIPIAACSSSI